MPDLPPSDPEMDRNRDWYGLLKRAPCGFVLTDRDGHILSANDTILGWIKNERAAIVGKKRIQELFTVGGRIYYETRHSPLFRMQDTVKEVNYDLLVGGKGKRMTVLVNSARHLDGAGDIATLQFVFLPFSDRKKYEAELLSAKEAADAATRAKSDFLSTFSHEIRTPIHAILNAGRILSQEDPRSDQRELLEAVTLAGEELLRLVNSVLDLNRMEGGHLTLDLHPFALKPRIEQTLRLFRPMVRNRGIDLRLVYAAEVPETVVGDAGKLTQVFNNLLGNAVKFTQQGSITLSVNLIRKTKRYCYLGFSLEDTGIGMTEAEVAKIFQPFSQANAGILGTFGGSGLGLSISSELLGIMEAKLEVESQPGRGTRFAFDLRFGIGSQAAPPSSSSETPVSTEALSHLRVLAVDDQPSNLLILSRYFKSWNIPFRAAKNGEEALTLLTKETFDLILMDVNMPVMDGYETARRIRSSSDPRLQSLPIVALSAHQSGEIMDRIKAVGINEVLQKPFFPNELYHCVLAFAPERPADAPDPLAASPVLTARSAPPSLTSLYAYFDHEEEAITSYLRMVSQEMWEVADEFEALHENPDLAAYKFVYHRSLSPLRLLNGETLDAKMKRGQDLLAAREYAAYLECSQDFVGDLRALHSWLAEVVDQRG